MAWNVELTADARRTLLRIDRTVAQRITQQLTDAFQPPADPFTVGEPLTGDWRVIFRVDAERVTSL